MSRTYKDKPHNVRFPEKQYGYGRVQIETPDYYVIYWADLPGVKAKKKKHVDTEWHWMGTPSWWTQMFMNRPRRSAENQQLRNMGDVEDFDFVDVKRKNHIYYW